MKGSTLGKVAIALIWGLLLSLVLAIGLEAFLKARWAKRREVKEVGLEQYDRLTKAYHPFAIQYIHPTYLFFFPFAPEDRVALSNAYVTLDRAGFRGPGPEQAAGRDLAFLLGGSTAFSFSSSDSTSITGYLNRLQDRYFFVNAGVPSWNSTQELSRLVNQVMAYEPALVLTLDGANELAIVVRYHELGLEYPPGTPESFGQLQTLVGDIRARSRLRPAGGLFSRFFPNLAESIRVRFTDQVDPGPIPEARLQATASKYTFNLSLMNSLVQAGGGRFAAFFQPIIWLHQNGPDSEAEYGYAPEYRRYHELVFADTARMFERYDLSDMFDAHFNEIPYFDPGEGHDLSDRVIFVDPVHFFDTGNRMIAEEILRLIAVDADD